MKQRLKMIWNRLSMAGQFVASVILGLLTLIISIILSPLWFVIWILSGWWFTTEAFKWIETTFPDGLVNNDL